MKILAQLAFRNIKKFKKNYIFMFCVIFIISLFFISYGNIAENQYNAEKQYNIEKYGEWYFQGTLIDKNQMELIPLEAKDNYFDKDFKHYYMYNQGETKEGYRIVYAQEEIYDFCKLLVIEGNKPRNDNEVMISSDMKEKQNIKLNDKINLNINHKDVECKIVGIIQNSQKEIFPDIYTNIKDGDTVTVVTNQKLIRDPNYPLYNTDHLATLNLSSMITNNFGYSGIDATAAYEYSAEEALILIESLACIVFALIAMYSTNAKHRNKEFALLRGIGMDASQMMQMLMFEMMIIVCVGVGGGFAGSFGINMLAQTIFEKTYGYSNYVVSLNTALFYAGVLVFCIMCAIFYPINSSARTALSGAFEGATFKKIQVRYRKLKTQTKIRLARREMGAYKKITYSTFIVFSLVSLLFTMSVFDPDEIIRDKEETKQMTYFYEFDTYDSDYYFNKYKKVVGLKRTDFIGNVEIDGVKKRVQFNVAIVDDYQQLASYKMEGHLPKEPNEVFLLSPYQWMGDIIGTNADGSDIWAEEQIERTIESSEFLTCNGISYKISGTLLPELRKTASGETIDEHPFPQTDVCMTKEDYKRIFGKEPEIWDMDYIRVCYSSPEEGNQIYNDIVEKEGNNNPYSNESLYKTVYDDKTNIRNVHIEPYTLIPAIFAAFVFLYYFNKNAMENNKKDIALYKLIGATNGDILLKQVCKGIVLTFFVAIVGIGWIFMMNGYYGVSYYPIMEYVFSIAVTLAATVIMYTLPTFKILKGDIFELIKGDE